MNVFQSHAPILTPPPGRAAISLEELSVCVRALDPGSRALLDLSLRRRLPLEAMAGFLQTDPFDLARRRARAVARIAAELDLDGYGVIATVKAALGRLPAEAWGVPVASRPERAAPFPVQAEAMATAARALMARLDEQRERVRRDAVVSGPVAEELAELEAGADDGASVTAEPASLGAELEAAEAEVAEGATVTGPHTGAAEVAAQLEARLQAELAQLADAEAKPAAEATPEAEHADTPDASEQPTVESEAIVLDPEPEPDADADDQPTLESGALRPWPPAASPMAATDMAAAFSQHPAFAVENAQPGQAAFLPPLAEALARAAASERAAAAEMTTATPLPETAPGPASEPNRPAAPLATPCADERAPRRRLAQGSILIGLLLALVRLLLGPR